ncbi:hypothetical protein JVU11DRAFT_9585 [Chiua virens]|nr:hypothetical protein JVU11DRAFT_9585 [Chiua virens]
MVLGSSDPHCHVALYFPPSRRPPMTRTRKLTLSMKEFSHLVSESLDMANAAPQSFVDNTAVVSETAHKPHSRQPSSFQRIFSRPTNTPRPHDDPEGPEGLPQTPHKMITWPFSRSPRKSRPQTGHQDNPIGAKDPCDSYVSPYAITSPAAMSTSSLGSLVSVSERLFQVTSRESDESSQNSHLFEVGGSSSISIVPPTPVGDAPTTSGNYDATNLLLHAAIFGNGSTTSISASSSRSTNEASSSGPDRSRTSFEGTEASYSVVDSKPSFDEDPTPRAATFGAKNAAPSGIETRDDPSSSAVKRWRRPQRLSLVVPVSSVEVLALRPAVGVAPHFPSEIECSASVFSASSPTSPVACRSSSTFPSTTELITSDSGDSPPRVSPFTPPNPRAYMIPDPVSSSPNLEYASPLGCSPRQRKRAMSPRSMTPPPLPRPPPTGPLPAIPSSSAPPVPPLPPLPAKMSMNMAPHSTLLSAPRSTISGAPTNPATALPPSPPGGLRLPSRLSWVNGVRAALPSPPASPTKSLKSLTGKTSQSHTKKQSKELKRPTSIGVIEAADSAQVRRTKSILLLGSKSKSSGSLSPKRVQIHADVNVDENAPSRKPRRKSSAATVSHLMMSSNATSPLTSSELLVLRERRHSAPMLSTLGRDMPGGVSADWTLSLPFCTDVPGNKILPSPSLTPQLKPQHGVLEEVEGEDWTLCMPLKSRVDTESTVESSEGCVSECTIGGTSETPGTVQTQTVVHQLPTPCPSPTLSTPESMILPLDLDEEETMGVPETVERPASPASLGPHVGGLDLAGGRGKRASGWHVYGWFDEVSIAVPEEVEEEEDSTVHVLPDCKSIRNHVTAFRKTHTHPSQDSTSTASTSETTFYSARSSVLTC